MIKLSQRDIRWAGERMGNSNVTVGRYGCLITSLSMLSDYFKPFHAPNYMAHNLGFTKDGLLIWGSMSKELSFKLYQRFNGYGWLAESMCKQALKDKDQAVVLQVQGYHWVVAIRKNLFKGYTIADPWTGKVTTTKDYQHKITGGAILQKI